MTPDLNDLFRLTKNETTHAVETLTKAFENDPLYSFLIPDEEKRNALLPHFFKFRLRYGLSYGEVYSISQNVEGLAVWLPYNNITMTPLRILKCGGFQMSLRAGKNTMNRLSLLEEFTSNIHKRNANFPHWYLSPIAVHPLFQRKGHAGTLLTTMLKRIDEEHLPCFLETQSEYNVSLYEKYGFKIVEENKLPGTNLTHWSMLRDKQ